MTKLAGVKFSVNKTELEKANTEASQEEIKESRPKQRLNKLINDVANVSDSDNDKANVELRFLLMPEKIIVSILIFS